VPAVTGVPFDDGSTLLTTAEVAPLLVAAVEHAGGTLTRWHLDHVDASPGRSTTATYAATVDWPGGPRRELLGASARVGGRRGNDERAVIFGDGEREVAVWLYPDDPDLPGLARAARPAVLAGLLTEHQVFSRPVEPAAVSVEMISYRPRRRAVVKATIAGPTGAQTLFVKVLPEAAYGPTLERHQLLLRAGIPAPVVAAATADFVLVLRPVAGRPLAQAIFDEAMPCTADNMIRLLDSMPPAVTALPRRPPWTDAVATYADIVTAAAPSLQPQLGWLVGQITTGLTGVPLGIEPTHGDFHEGQLFVSRGLITGMIDIDTIGPGRRADDLACMIAHLSTVQRMSAEQSAGLTRLIALWLAAFDARVDPRELRLRSAGVIISLATGPYRSQEPAWLADTQAMINTAETLVRAAVG
jgi:hypothetical protein